MLKSYKEIIKRLNKTCAVCGRKMKVILYKDRTYRGGHYFGKIPLFTKKELKKALKAGTHKVRIGDSEIEVLNRNPKPCKYEEYWECPKCYWRK
jgi:hypothetical protein